MSNTIEAIRPELRKKYQEIAGKYQKDKWGIYDDTVDLNRAVKLSDAYYGDQSSVLQLSEKAKIPVMLQNVYVVR